MSKTCTCGLIYWHVSLFTLRCPGEMPNHWNNGMRSEAKMCQQPRGKDTPGYRDLIFYDQYLRRNEQFNEK